MRSLRRQLFVTMRPTTRSLFALFSLCGMLLSILGYLLSLIGRLVDTIFPLMVPLVIGGLALAVCMLDSEHSSTGKWTYSWRQITQGMPRWANRCYVSLQLIAAAHFVWTAFRYGLGAPAIINGEYVLDSRGRILRVLSQTEYMTLRGIGLRTVAAIMVCLYFVPLTYWGGRRVDLTAE